MVVVIAPVIVCLRFRQTFHWARTFDQPEKQFKYIKYYKSRLM